MAKAASTKTPSTQLKATKAKPTAKKPAVKKTAAKSSASKAKATSTAKRPPAKQPIPIPKGWPVSSKPTQPAAKSGEEQPTHLTPGNLLQVNCNGSDVFLRKRATQPATSLSLPTSTKTKGPTRFLVVFPGRLSLKPPEKKADINPVDDDEEDKEQVEEPTESAEKKPFAPANPPQLLGKLKEGPDNQMQLHIPFEGDGGKQLVFSGRAIPVDGKFMTLSFKRTGGKDSKKKSKLGTGSIACKDVFRSVIVLGDSKLEGGDAKPTTYITEEDGENEEVVMRHYGGSYRTVDGGGQGSATSRKSIGAKRDSLCSTKSSATEKSVDSRSDSSDNESDGIVNDNDPDSDGEFVPSKKISKSGAKEDKSVAPEPKRTSRRSTSKTMNVSYADEDSDVDMDNASESEKSEDAEPSESEDEFDELLDNIAKKPKSATKPKIRASSGSDSSKKNSYADIDSDDEDDDVIVLDASTNGKKKKAKNSKPVSLVKKPKSTSKQATQNGAVKTSKPTKTEVSSPSKSPITPRRRKKASPHKSPISSTKKDVIDLSDDSFSFL